jgi:hypothetical protein
VSRSFERLADKNSCDRSPHIGIDREFFGLVKLCAGWLSWRIGCSCETERVAVGPERVDVDFVSLVEAYCRRVTPAVLEQHRGSSVSSPLGIWLLLAATAGGASGNDRTQLEDALGCPASDAALLLARFLDRPPPALVSALALWVRQADITAAFSAWSAGLPSQVERGGVPSQAGADSWADHRTQGLIQRFPVQISSLTQLILTSVLATKVSWQTPFAVAAANEQLPAASPWLEQISHVLLDETPSGMRYLADTNAAGVVAVHVALAVEDLAVMSVSADPVVDRVLVVEAAYELASRSRRDETDSLRCSLFDVPVGRGHSWEITEREVASSVAGERLEEVVSATLPAWTANSDLDLKASPLFGAGPAVSALLGLIGAHPAGVETEAVQSASASYSPQGFEAAAVTAFAVRAAALLRPSPTGLKRQARLCFDHPYATVALSATADDFRRIGAGHSEGFCLPLFSAWVTTAEEPRVHIAT